MSIKARLSYCALLIAFSCLPALSQGTIIAAGGGAEGDIGDTTAWSYTLYKKLIENGDTNGDGIISVAILANSFPSKPADANWLPDYFAWIGQTKGSNVQAFNLQVASRSDADNASLVGPVANADVIFIKGGDQGLYYDNWNETLLESHIRTVVQSRNGAICGTSAGAMSLATYCFSGGMDMISSDVMADAHTSFLDDASQPGTSGIHTDFLNFINGVTIDTHFTQRGRLGRLIGILAKSTQDFNNNTILAIGIEKNTGIAINGNTAEVIGTGSVAFVRRSAQTQLMRDQGRPLVFTDLKMDRLTHGWQYDLVQQTALVATAPAGTQDINITLADLANSGAVEIAGNIETDNQKFGYAGSYYPDDYSRIPATGSPYIIDSVGFTLAGDSNTRADKHETLFHLLYDQPRDLGFLVFSGARLTRQVDSADIISFEANGQAMSAIVIDASSATKAGLSPFTSNWATSGGQLRAAAFVGLTVHVLAESAARDLAYNTRTRQLTTAPQSGGNGGGNTGALQEQEPNDSLDSAEELNGLGMPIDVEGTLDVSSDRDYFTLELAPGDSIDVTLAVPAGVDFDLYLLDRRGRTIERSVNDGNGLDESLQYSHTGRRAETIYLEISSYSGATSEKYTLSIR